jgi:hypothetical protein
MDKSYISHLFYNLPSVISRRIVRRLITFAIVEFPFPFLRRTDGDVASDTIILDDGLQQPGSDGGADKMSPSKNN